MNIESERSAFEAAAAETYKGWAVGRDVGGVYGASSWTGTSYMNAYTDLAWELWKKARAALTASAPNHSEQVEEIARLRELLTAWRRMFDGGIASGELGVLRGQTDAALAKP